MKPIMYGALLLGVAMPGAAMAQDGGAQADVDRVIVFGDSLSDGGFYDALLNLPEPQGSFTTNPDPVAPEVFAALQGFDLRPFYGEGGTNYAIGGARVSAPAGITIPIRTQVANFLASDDFRPGDVAYIQGGGNDFFAYQAGGSVDTTILTSAANDLAAAVADLEAAGARRIVTMAVQTDGTPDTAGIGTFNATFRQALAAQGSNALFFSTDILYAEIAADPAAFGIVNLTDPACTTPSSLNCTRDTLVTPDANETYVLADAVHPTGIAQRIQGQAIASLFDAPAQLGALGLIAQQGFRRHRTMYEMAQRGGVGQDGPVGFFGQAGYGYSDVGNAARERSFNANLGADLKLGDLTGVGIVGSYSEGDGSYALGGGDFDTTRWSVSGYGRASVGPVGVLADVSYGEGDIDSVRRVILGPAVRTNAGNTDTRYFAASAQAHFDIDPSPDLMAGPEIGIGYEDLDIDGFAESGGSTSVAFGEREIRSLTGTAGLVTAGQIAGGVGFLARATYVHEFEDDAYGFSLTPAGAPISWSDSLGRPDEDYVRLALGVNGVIGPVGIRAGASGEFGRAELDSVTAYGGVSLAF